jgi:hypothetical protein
MNTIAKVDQPGLTKLRNLIETLVLIAVSIITVWTLYKDMVPSWQSRGGPFLLAVVAGAITVVCLWLTRWLGSRATRFASNAFCFSCRHASCLRDGLVRGMRPRSEFVDLGRASGIGTLCCFRLV